MPRSWFEPPEAVPPAITAKKCHYRTLIKSRWPQHSMVVTGLLPALCTTVRKSMPPHALIDSRNPSYIHEPTTTANCCAERAIRATSPGMLFLDCPRHLTLCHAPRSARAKRQGVGNPIGGVPFLHRPQAVGSCPQAFASYRQRQG